MRLKTIYWRLNYCTDVFEIMRGNNFPIEFDEFYVKFNQPKRNDLVMSLAHYYLNAFSILLLINDFNDNDLFCIIQICKARKFI